MKIIRELLRRRSLAIWLSAALVFGSMPVVSVMADVKPYIELDGEGIRCENTEEGCLITIESSGEERNFAIRGVAEDGIYRLNLILDGMDQADYPVRVLGQPADGDYTRGTVSGFPRIGKIDGKMSFFAKADGTAVEEPYSMDCRVSVNLAPPKVDIVDGKLYITDEDNDPEGSVFYVASAINMTKSAFLARYKDEDDENPFLNEISEGPLEPGQEEELCYSDAVFIHNEFSVDDLVKRAAKINPDDMLYIYAVNTDTDFEDSIDDSGWYMPEKCAQISLSRYVGVAGYSVKDGTGLTISGDSISFTSSKDAQSLWFKPVSKDGGTVSEEGINSVTVLRNGFAADDLYLSGNVSENGYTEVHLNTKPHLGSYSLSVFSNGRVSANSTDRFVKDYKVSVNAAPAKVYCVSGNLTIEDEDNAKDQVFYLVSSNYISRNDLKESLDKMIEIEDGVSSNVITDVISDNILYAYTVNRDTDPDDGVDDRGVYMSGEACRFIIDIPEPEPEPEPEIEPLLSKFNAYQVSGNDFIATDVSGNRLFDVSLITGLSDNGSYESVSLDRVSSDENGNIAIDPGWLGRDIMLKLSGVSSNTVYLPVVRFIDDELILDTPAPKVGDAVTFTASTNSAYVDADITWYSLKAGEKARLGEGDSFERGVSYNASIYVHTVSVNSLLEKELRLIQFIPGYEELPRVPYASVSNFAPVKDPVARTDGKNAGCDNYTGFTVDADYGPTQEYLYITDLILDDWKDIEWTENWDYLNEELIKGRVVPSNADEKLTVSFVDTYLYGKLAAGASANSAVSSDNVVSSLSINKTDDRGGFTIKVTGTGRPGAGFATLHLDTDKGRNKVIEQFRDILVTVKYRDVTGVSINNVTKRLDNGSVYSTMKLTGLVPCQYYQAFSVSDNKFEQIFFLSGKNGEYTNRKFKNAQVTINRFHIKQKTIPQYIILYGKEQVFSVSECKGEPSSGLMFLYQSEWVYTGSKITPVVTAYDGDKQLIEGQDFTVSYKKNLDAGNATIVIKGKNGSVIEKQEKQFTIKPANISDATIIPVISKKGKAGAQPIVVYNGSKMSQKKTYEKLSKDQLKCSVGKVIQAEIKGTKNFTGTAMFEVHGVEEKPSLKGVKLNQKKFSYNGHWNFDKEQVKKAVNGVTEETADIELPLNNENFLMGNAGSYKLAVCGKGNYAGFVKFLNFKITPVKSGAFSLNKSSLTYNPAGAVFERDDYTLTGINNENLIEGMDYTISYKKNKKAGQAKITITFKGSYKGTRARKTEFTIDKANIQDAIDDVFAPPVAKESKAKKNPVYITDNNVLLKKGKKKDYDTNYLGGGKMTITGTGNYTGSFDVEFTVGGGDDISKAKLKAGKDQKLYFNGLLFSDKAKDENNVSVQCNKSAEFRFFNNLYKGKAVCVAYGDGKNSTGSKSVKFTIRGSGNGYNIEDMEEEFDPYQD